MAKIIKLIAAFMAVGFVVSATPVMAFDCSADNPAPWAPCKPK
ncbi:hypothetical protein [Duganella guangzhouensis]|nr:hypothetical protein [Duganella guangzhouensis]